MIKKLLRNIRQKPKAVREQYAFWIAASLTSVVALGWVFATTVRLTVNPVGDKTVNTSVDTLSNFLEGVQDRLSTIKPEVPTESPSSSTKKSLTEIDLSAITETQAASVSTTPPVTKRQEIRIATTSASTSVADQ